MAKKKKILYPVVFMIMVTVAFSSLLAFINEITQETIDKQEALRVQKSVLYAFGTDMFDATDNDVIESFNQSIKIETVDERNIYIYEGKGYAFEFSGKGLWGTVTGHVAVSPDHTEILGINFISHQETPGLGGRIDEDVFKMQFQDLRIGTEDIITLNKATGGNVDAISGATLTSLAVRDIINSEVPEILDFAVKEGYYEGN